MLQFSELLYCTLVNAFVPFYRFLVTRQKDRAKSELRLGSLVTRSRTFIRQAQPRYRRTFLEHHAQADVRDFADAGTGDNPFWRPDLAAASHPLGLLSLDAM